MVLHGNNVRVVTHTPLGGTRSVTVPVSDVSCIGSRIGESFVQHIATNGPFAMANDRGEEYVTG